MIGLFSLVLFCYWLEQSVAGRHNGKRNKAWLKCCSMYIRVFHLTIFVLPIKVFQVSFNTPGSISTSIFALTLSDSVPNLIMIILMYVCPVSFQTLRISVFQKLLGHYLLLDQHLFPQKITGIFFLLK